MVERKRDAYHSNEGRKDEEIHFFSLSVLVNMEGGVAKVGERKSPCATVGDLCVTNSSHVPDFK